MLTRGSARQLDICDAWSESLDWAAKGGLRNRSFKTSDIVQAGEIPVNEYDFCYALSIFTHLNKEAFENNLRALAMCLKKGGRLYFTVRHKSFMEKMSSLGRIEKNPTFDETGFWHNTYSNKSYYGETAVEPRYVEALAQPLGNVFYLGIPEHEQNLYRITII